MLDGWGLSRREDEAWRKGNLEKISIFVFSASHSRDIEPCHDETTVCMILDNLVCSSPDIRSRRSTRWNNVICIILDEPMSSSPGVQYCTTTERPQLTGQIAVPHSLRRPSTGQPFTTNLIIRWKGCGWCYATYRYICYWAIAFSRLGACPRP